MRIRMGLKSDMLSIVSHRVRQCLDTLIPERIVVFSEAIEHVVDDWELNLTMIEIDEIATLFRNVAEDFIDKSNVKSLPISSVHVHEISSIWAKNTAEWSVNFFECEVG